MADYGVQTYVDDDGSGSTGTAFTKARMDHMEAGIDDAAEHHKRGLFSALPAAAAANKNWTYDCSDTGQQLISTGSAWVERFALPYGYQSATKVCAHSLAAGAQFKTNIDNAGGSGGAIHPWGKRVQVFRVSSDGSPGYAARIRCYATTAQQNADAGRARGVDPAGGTDHGLLLEVITTNALLAFELSPVVDLYNRESPRTSVIPITIDNLDIVTRTVAIYFDFQVIEP